MVVHTGDVMRERVVELTTEFVEYPTTADRPEAIEACMDRVAAFFDGTESAIERYRDDGVPSLVASLTDSKTPELMFQGHLDVMPAAERLFTPRRDANHLYGRGTADMKGGLAAMMHTLRDIAEENPEQSIAMMVVADEEEGGVHGAEYLLEEEEYRPEFCITGEPNNLGGHMHVINKQEGVIQVELSTTGQAAHAATPEQGKSAIEKHGSVSRDQVSVRRQRHRMEHDGQLRPNTGWRNSQSGPVVRGG
jgi:succinyl-diaminopimelate desuccinylase